MSDAGAETIDFRCPNCGQLLRSSEGQAGIDRTCAVCGTVTTTPRQSEAIEATTVHSGLRVPPPRAVVLSEDGTEEPTSAREASGERAATVAPTTRLTPAERKRRHEELLRRLTARSRLFIPQSLYSILVTIVLLTGCFLLFRGLFVPGEFPPEAETAYQLTQMQLWGGYWAMTAVHLVIAIALLVGIVSLQRMQYWWIAVTGAIIGMLPLQFYFPLTFPTAAWLLWLLFRPEIRNAFRSEELPPISRSEP